MLDQNFGFLLACSHPVAAECPACSGCMHEPIHFFAAGTEQLDVSVPAPVVFCLTHRVRTNTPTLCQNEHVEDPGSHLDLSLAGLERGAILLSRFRSPDPRHGLAYASLLRSLPARLDNWSKQKLLRPLALANLPRICIPSRDPAPKNPAPKNVPAQIGLQVLTVAERITLPYRRLE